VSFPHRLLFPYHLCRRVVRLILSELTGEAQSLRPCTKPNTIHSSHRLSQYVNITRYVSYSPDNRCHPFLDVLCVLENCDTGRYNVVTRRTWHHICMLLQGIFDYEKVYSALPIPVATWSKACVCGSSLAGIVGSNPAGDTDVSLLCVLCVVR
jgi:hypothetical protein